MILFFQETLCYFYVNFCSIHHWFSLPIFQVLLMNSWAISSSKCLPKKNQHTIVSVTKEREWGASHAIWMYVLFIVYKINWVQLIFSMKSSRKNHLTHIYSSFQGDNRPFNSCTILHSFKLHIKFNESGK